MSLTDSLNQYQREAVEHLSGPLLIIAGAGAGKTKTITHRILNLIKHGVAPRNILAITFTNKSAKEMRERVEKLLEEDAALNRPVSFTEKPFVSTFHSLGVHIIKENSQLIGVPRHFAIFDRNDSKRAVKDAIESLGFDTKQYEPGKFLNIISKQKGDLITVTDYANKVGNDYTGKIVLSVWKKYEETLQKESALDFDDLILKTAKLLETNKEVREKYQNQWKYIHIDEYQDTNEVQYNIAKLLAANHRQICVVGDVDQNIYSWRGAKIKNILDFEKNYPEAKVVLLEENYRSTQTILAVANKIIEKNKHRVEKKLFTKNVEGEKVGMYSGYDEGDEARFVAKKTHDLIKNGTKASEIAVLYRANFQSRALEEAFLSEAIPYQILGTRFFERKEVKDILCFVRAALNPDSISDIKRIINAPPRGIGKVTLLKMIEKKEDELPAATRAKVESFKALLGRIAEYARTQSPSVVLRYVLMETGIETLLKNGNDEDKERLENVRELVTLATRYDMMPLEEGIEKLLSDAALASDQDDMIKEEEAVKLMTVHASKGLEFDYVFVTGLEEDLFPHKKIGERAVSSEEDEEERRLFYVAITRARLKLFITYASIRMIFGSRQVNVPSEFVFDIDDEYIEKEEGDEGARGARKPLLRIDF
ncbi:MAG: UvrD-helicase domain-containing protein [Candidatus Paceibacterota bacterium]|jgi:DNA helicase-2/ATP-dependent DNA helicase PcrA